MVVELIEDDVDDKSVQDEMSEAGCGVNTCINVLHDVVVVDLDLQDEKVELGLTQGVQVEEEKVDKNLNEPLDDLT